MKHSVAGIVCIDSLFLVAHRIPVGVMGGRWEFPGGKVEQNETFQQAVVREFKEEFSIPVNTGKLITEVTFNTKDSQIRLHAFEVKFPEDDYDWVLTEHTDIKWIKFDEIEKLYFVDSDLLLLPAIKCWKFAT